MGVAASGPAALLLKLSKVKTEDTHRGRRRRLRVFVVEIADGVELLKTLLYDLTMSSEMEEEEEELWVEVIETIDQFVEERRRRRLA